mgnify:CR=1 FL=1
MEQTEIPKSSEELLTANEICDKLKIADSTLRNYLKNENFPRLKLGGEYRFLYSEVLNYMRSKSKVVTNDKA